MEEEIPSQCAFGTGATGWLFVQETMGSNMVSLGIVGLTERTENLGTSATAPRKTWWNSTRASHGTQRQERHLEERKLTSWQSGS